MVSIRAQVEGLLRVHLGWRAVGYTCDGSRVI